MFVVVQAYYALYIFSLTAGVVFAFEQILHLTLGSAVDISAFGIDDLRLSLEYGFETLQASDLRIPDPVLIFEMSDREIQNLLEEIDRNLYSIMTMLGRMGF